MKKLVKIIASSLIAVLFISVLLFFAWLFTVLGTGALFIIFSVILYGFGALLLILLIVRLIEHIARREKKKDE